MRSRVVLALLLPLLLAACGEQTGPGRAEDRSGIGGTYTADGLPDWARGVDRLGLELSHDQLRFSAGCNQFSGSVTWEVDGDFSAGPLAGTEMGCEQRAMEADTKLADFFQRADHLELDGTDIRISAGDEGIWFVPTSEQPGEQPAAVGLEGTDWRLTGIGEYSGDVGGMMSIPDDVSSTLRIEDGELTFEDGCNTGFGHAVVEGDELVLSGVGGTLKGCPGPIGEIEQGVLRVLRDGSLAWSIDGKHLMLLTANHRYQLDYQAE
jgi:heat shock protein HslJ